MKLALDNDCMNSLEWIMTHYGDRRIRFFNSMFQVPTFKQTTVFFLLHIAVLRNDRQVAHMILSLDDAADTHDQRQHAKSVLQTYFSKAQMEFFTKETLDSLRYRFVIICIFSVILLFLLTLFKPTGLFHSTK